MAGTAEKEQITIKIDKSGRAGKTVTVLEGFKMHPDGKQNLLSNLKKRCGAGGTVKSGKLEIQGDQRNLLKALLEKMGYSVRAL